MAAQDFDNLVKKIEVIARRNPTYYRRRLLLLACLGYVYIGVVFLLVNAVLWGLWRLSSQIPDFADGSGLSVVAILIAFGFLSRFFIRVKKPVGVALNRTNAPQLFETLDRLSRQMKAPKLHRVVLQDNLNAGIMQFPFLGFIGWHTNYLLVGLPLMQALSPKQFEAVMAHELAHLCGGDGKMSAWIYRIRQTWYGLSGQFDSSDRGNFLFRRFFSWYGPFFKAYSFVHARAQEYEADRKAGELVGKAHKAEALLWLTTTRYFLGEYYWPAFRKRMKDVQTPPDDLMIKQLEAIRDYPTDGSISQQKLRCWVQLRLTNKTDNKSTHPCLADRWEALEYTLPDVLVPSQRRATVLLGEGLKGFTQQLNEIWQKEEQASWKWQYAMNLRQVERLKALNEKSVAAMTTEERVKQAVLARSIEGEEAALPLLKSIVADVPEQTTARYWLGHYLVRRADFDEQAEGIGHLEFVINNNPRLLHAANWEICKCYFMRNQAGFDDERLQRWHDDTVDWMQAKEERDRLTRVTKFVPHDIAESEVRQMVSYFATFPEIRAVCLAKQVMAVYPEYPHYVFAIARNYPMNSSKDHVPNHHLRWFIESGLAFSASYTAMFFSESVHLLPLRRLEGALLYKQKQEN